MSDKYILVGQTPVPCDDLLEWARWFETEDRRVLSTLLPWGCWVSTVFLGLDHNYRRQCGLGGLPILFESMAFWPDGDCYEQDRCSTWVGAERMHAAMVAQVARPRAVCAWVLRSFYRYWERARWDARDSWDELRGRHVRAQYRWGEYQFDA